ncbi:MAG: ABC transporter substrate-binding protein [Alphaproteobacteria bacterium 65-37]|nr:MAG: ABC transporter substrate-binding protein [Alphaproteobacteria bacterium 65-37]
MPVRWGLRVAVVAFAAIVIASTGASAYPDKPVKLLVGYAPGGSTDIVARVLAPVLSAKWGQPVVVENKPGASGMVAAEQTARAVPDGYTLLLGYTPEVSINKLVFHSMRYDPIADLTPVILAAAAPLVLVSGPKLAAGDLQTLRAQQPPGARLSFGSPGIGGQQHMAGEMLCKLTGLPLMHVPYRGTALAVNDLLGGQIDLFFATTPPLLQHIKSGKLKPILVAGDKREKVLPDVPTAAEVGLPALQLANWFGVFAPKGLPAPLAEKIAADVMEALKDPAVAGTLEDQGLTPQSLKGDTFRKFIAAEMVKYEAIVAQTGIRAEP